MDDTKILMHRTPPKYMIEHASSYTLSGVISRLEQLGGYLKSWELCKLFI